MFMDLLHDNDVDHPSIDVSRLSLDTDTHQCYSLAAGSLFFWRASGGLVAKWYQYHQQASQSQSRISY